MKPPLPITQESYTRLRFKGAARGPYLRTAKLQFRPESSYFNRDR
jgi:hypothetical protein